MEGIKARRTTYSVNVGGVMIGGKHPVVVQSMTDTKTADTEATARQIAQLAEAGSELVRITVNTEEAAQAVPVLVRRLESMGISIPLIGDFHYNGHILLPKYPECAAALAKYRINPGNVGSKRRDEHFQAIVEIAIKYNKPIRIGANWGSLDQELTARLMEENARRSEPWPVSRVKLEALAESCLGSARRAEELGLPPQNIVLSAKTSSVPELIAINRYLAAHCSYPLHIGLTEAGSGLSGAVASAAGAAVLLAEGIGDTLRVSLTPSPGGDRADEVRVARQILQALDLRRFCPQITSCPGCGRTTSSRYRELAAAVQAFVDEQMPHWRSRYPGVENLRIAVMGCVVNGPGESRHADIGISLPGDAEEPAAPVFIEGKRAAILQGENLTADFLKMIASYVKERFKAR